MPFARKESPGVRQAVEDGEALSHRSRVYVELDSAGVRLIAMKSSPFVFRIDLYRFLLFAFLSWIF